MSASTPSGVRNLRAMFENQSATNSPEPRNRSPTAKPAIDRPISKVRASFVPVEGSTIFANDLGTNKGTPDGVNSLDASRRESFSVSQEDAAELVADLKKIVSEEKEAREANPAVTDPVPEQAVESRDPSTDRSPAESKTKDAMPNLGTIMKGSDFPEPSVEEQKTSPQEPAPQEPIEQKAAEVAQVSEPSPVEHVAPSVDVPGDNPDKTISGVQDSEATLKLADPKDEAAISGGQALPPPTEVLPQVETPKAAPEASKDKPSVTAPVSTSKAKATGAAATSAPKPAAKKPTPISTSKAPVKTTAIKSPLPKPSASAKVPRTPTTPKTAHGPTSRSTQALSKPQPQPQPKAPVVKPPRASLKPSNSSSTTTKTEKVGKNENTEKAEKAGKPEKVEKVEKAGKAGKADKAEGAPAEKHSDSKAHGAKFSEASKDGGKTSPFRKPKPKSPTRPVRLPAHLTAPTASYAAKHDDKAAQTAPRKPSTVSRPAAIKPAAAVKKPTSRASLAPQPAKRPESRASTKGAADEGFLARMMRPTASSASKTHDRTGSPPRRTASVKAPAKAKSIPEKAVAKGKQKVGEAVAKVKDAVTNGNTDSEHPTEGSQAESVEQPEAAEHGAVAESSEAPAEIKREETPPAEQVESSSVDVLQTPQFDVQTIR